jgi:hypothetical protein
MKDQAEKLRSMVNNKKDNSRSSKFRVITVSCYFLPKKRIKGCYFGC